MKKNSTTRRAPSCNRKSCCVCRAAVVRGGGEGLVLHRSDAPWAPGRDRSVLKLKPQQDAEAQVVAHEPGRGRLTGLMGALQVRGFSAAWSTG